MNFLDKFRYSFDNLNEIENLKNEDKEKKNIYNNPFLKSLLSNSVKVLHIVLSKKISDHWKEKVVPHYAILIFKKSLIVIFFSVLCNLVLLHNL